MDTRMIEQYVWFDAFSYVHARRPSYMSNKKTTIYKNDKT